MSWRRRGRPGGWLFPAACWLVSECSVLPQPVLPPPGLPADTVDPAALRVQVTRFRYHGNTVFSDEVLDQVLKDYRGRPLGTGELEEARRLLTVHYVRAGYVNSGAILEDQDLAGGVVVFTIREGVLSHITLDGHRRLWPGPLKYQIERHTRSPLNLHRLQEGLLLLKENPNLERVNAELKPGGVPGTSVLEVQLEESNPWHLDLELRNDRPPSVGAELLEARASHSNLTGLSDELIWRYGITHGGLDELSVSEFNDWGISYSLRVPHTPLSVRAYFDESDYDIVEEPFDGLGVQSQSKALGVALRYPLVESLQRAVVLGVSGERRTSQTFVFGEPFSISAGAVEGEASVSVLRFSQEWIERSQRRVLALRSTISLGVDLFSSTDDGTGRDGTFVSWLGQGQYILRLGSTQHQLVLNTSVRWASDPMLSLEQFSLGGAYTVRGYRENQLVRDMGWISSMELHVPVWFSRTGKPLLSLVPFFDYGRGWNAATPTPAPSDIASAGVGLIFTPHEKVMGRLFWGYPFRDLNPSDDNLQDLGIHFRLAISVW